MGMTITEKILSAHREDKPLEPGEIVELNVDLLLANDITAPLAIEQFEKLGAKKVFDPEKIALVLDHFVPAKDIASAHQAKLVREFAEKYGIIHFFEAGEGIEHSLLPEQGLITAGDLIIGADSHTCTYGALGAFATGVGSTDLLYAMVTGKLWLRVPSTIRVEFRGKRKRWVCGKDFILYTISRLGADGANYQALEFCGDALAELSIYSRFTMCNMAIEAGAKNGIIRPDDKTINYLKEHKAKRPKVYQSDPDARYSKTIEVNVEEIEPLVSLPHLPENVKPARSLSEIKIDQVVIGSCTNGWLEDLEISAELLRNRKVAKGTRLIVIPGTRRIYLEAMRKGLLEIFLEAGGVISPPTCGPCLGGHMGVLAKGERAVATTNRNFIGRMGHKESEVYLCGPAVASASAVLGRIGSPEEIF